MANIMICDDSMFMRIQLKNILEKAGHVVIAEAKDGMEAIEKYRALNNKIDIVTLDITMPILDGVSALRLLKSEFPKAKVIMISATRMENDVMECAKLGIESFIIKPYKEANLLNTIKNITDKYGIK